MIIQAEQEEKVWWQWKYKKDTLQNTDFQQLIDECIAKIIR
jgi:hypothetical protein